MLVQNQSGLIQFREIGNELVVDSKMIAYQIGIEHASLLKTIDRHLHLMTSNYGIKPITYERHVVKRLQGGTHLERQAWLTESQLRFLLARCRSGLSVSAVAQFANQGWNLSEFAALPLQRRKRKESDYSNNLSRQLKGSREVYTPAGNIDVLTSFELIEVKVVKEWKSAVGQVIIYSDYYPLHQKRIHLYGKTQESVLAMIRAHCAKKGIIVTWEP